MRTIGGTAMSTIAGKNPFQSRMALYLYLTGEIDGQSENDAMEWGVRLESVIAKKFAETHPKYEIADLSSNVIHPDHPFITGRPDRAIIKPGESHMDSGVEIKTCSPWSKDGFGEEGTDEIPPGYFVQCNHYMGLCECEDWYLAVLIGGSDYREYRLDFDEELYDTCIDAAVRFWNEHVVPRIPPEDDRPDDLVRKYLASKYAKSVGESRPATLQENAIVAGLSVAYTQKKEAEFKYDLLAQSLLGSIKDGRKILSELGWIGVTRGQRDTIDWKSVAFELERFKIENGVNAPGIPSELIEEYTKTGDPYSYISVPRDWGKTIKEKLNTGLF